MGYNLEKAQVVGIVGIVGMVLDGWDNWDQQINGKSLERSRLR